MSLILSGGAVFTAGWKCVPPKIMRGGFCQLVTSYLMYNDVINQTKQKLREAKIPENEIELVKNMIFDEYNKITTVDNNVSAWTKAISIATDKYSKKKKAEYEYSLVEVARKIQEAEDTLIGQIKGKLVQQKIPTDDINKIIRDVRDLYSKKIKDRNNFYSDIFMSAYDEVIGKYAKDIQEEAGKAFKQKELEIEAKKAVVSYEEDVTEGVSPVVAIGVGLIGVTALYLILRRRQ